MDNLLDLSSLFLDTRTQGSARRAWAHLRRLAEDTALDEEMEAES
jgi:hypothetical protein